jgi:CRP-like cAMP-binding protein
MSHVADPSILQSSELFAGLADADLRSVLDAGSIRRVAKGQLVFAQGDDGLTCHNLLHGRIKIVKSRPDGGQSVLRFIGPGEMYGTVAAMMGQPFPADALAIVDSVEVVWTTPAFRTLMKRYPEIGIRCMSCIGFRLMELQTRIGELTADRVERRIARTLSRLARQAGRRAPEGIVIDFPLTRQDLAEMSGSTLHTVSRTLSSWDQQGITESSRRHIVIRKPHALVAMAEDLPAEH